MAKTTLKKEKTTVKKSSSASNSAKATLDKKASGDKPTKKVAKTPVEAPVKSTKPIKEPETMEELLAQTNYQFHGLKRGSFVEGSVKAISGREIKFDVGAKTEGVVQDVEIPYIRDFISRLKIGDKLTCYVVSPENDEGQVVLSLRKASSEQKWEHLIRAQKDGTIL